MKKNRHVSNILLLASDLLSSDIDTYSQDLGLDPEEVKRVLGGEPTSDPALRAIVALGEVLGQNKTASAGDAPSGDLPEWGTRAELLATASGVPLSKIESILSEYPIEKLPMLLDATYKKLGVSSVAARRIRAAIKLATWVQIQITSPKSRVSDARAIYQRFKYLEFYEQEVFICVLLNNRNEIIQSIQVSKGALDATQVHPREAFQAAIRIGARSIVFVHNHPSGDPNPSSEDRALTGRLIEVGKLVGIPVLDHVIIGLRGYFSFVESGMMKEGMRREANGDDFEEDDFAKDDFSWEEEEAEQVQECLLRNLNIVGRSKLS